MKIAVIQKVRRPSFKRVNQSRWVLYSGNTKSLCNSGETTTTWRTASTGWSSR